MLGFSNGDKKREDIWLPTKDFKNYLNLFT
jgi:carboxypeptidase C (cathepsin A)